MKKILTIVAIALFTVGANAQTTKTSTKSAEKECHSSKTMSADEIAKCKAKCKAEGKTCTSSDKAKGDKEAKSCCAKKA